MSGVMRHGMAGMRAGRWGVVRRMRECGRRWVVMVQSGGMANLVNFKSAITILAALAPGVWCEIASKPGRVFQMCNPEATSCIAEMKVYGPGQDGETLPFARDESCIRIPAPRMESELTITFA